jgi:hypothetical protein
MTVMTAPQGAYVQCHAAQTALAPVSGLAHWIITQQSRLLFNHAAWFKQVVSPQIQHPLSLVV